MNNDCPTCKNKQNLTNEQIEKSIAQQLLLEIDLATNEERDKRLNICETCPELIGYTCIKCGCFAKFRASLQVKKCPIKKW